MRDCYTLRITLADNRHRRGKHLLEGDGDELAHFVEPGVEGLGDLDDAGLRLLGDGDGEVIGRNVLFGGSTDGELYRPVSATSATHQQKVRIPSHLTVMYPRR